MMKKVVTKLSYLICLVKLFRARRPWFCGFLIIYCYNSFVHVQPWNQFSDSHNPVPVLSWSNMLSSYEEVPYIEISDSEDEEAEGTQCQFPSCDFSVPPTRKNAIAAMEFHVMDRHSERRKALAIQQAFPPHSFRGSAMCRICKEKGKSVKLKFVSRERHVITRHSNLFDTKWTREWTDRETERLKTH